MNLTESIPPDGPQYDYTRAKWKTPDEPSVTYAQHSEGLVAARSVPADSAALYEAVNAWVEAITADKEVVGASKYEELDASNRAIDRTHEAVLDAAYALAQTRYLIRRAQQTEREA